MSKIIKKSAPSLSYITCTSLIGTTAFISGAILLLFWSTIFDCILSTVLVLKPDNFMFDMWKKAPMTVYMDFYFFNWTNPDEIHDPTKKPRFTEVGPYRFVEEREKVNLTWNNNDTVTYRILRGWYFDEEGSVGKLSDYVTTLNAVSMSAANHVKDWGYFMKKSFSITAAAISPRIEVTKTVGELLFDGYKDPFVDLARTIPFLANAAPPFDRFGWFYLRNQSYTFDGVFNVGTGGEKILGELYNWNFGNETIFFEGECAKVHGSAAELYPGEVKKDKISFFSPDMCRNVQLDFEEEVFVYNIRGYKFSAQNSMLDNGSLIPENQCFCNGECVPSGMLNVSSCRYGTPAFVSLPHYYHPSGDHFYENLVEGLKGERNKHELYITLEPRTGIALDVAIRLQLNMMVFPVEYITLYEDVPKVFFPLLWFEQKVTMPENLAFSLKILLSTPTTMPIISYILLVVGALAIIHVVSKIAIRRMFRFENSCLQEEVHGNYKQIKRKRSIYDFFYS